MSGVRDISGSFVKRELARLSRLVLERSLTPRDPSSAGKASFEGRVLVDFSSNDYLGLSREPVLLDGAIQALRVWGAGSGASRLMSGDLSLHHQVEQEVAGLKGGKAALLFGCGYLANTGIIPAICSAGDAVFADRLCHASMVDGVLLSRARLHRFRHNDVDHLEELLKARRDFCRKAWIMVESLYSMDGDRAPIADLLDLKERYGAMLYVDEAHAFGIMGGDGEGLVPRSATGRIEITVGTFGKALGSYGAFAVTDMDMRAYLVNRSRTFIFSTALPAAVLGANLAALRIVGAMKDRRAKVERLAARLRASLCELSLPTIGDSHIVPLVVGSAERAVSLAGYLEAQGFYARAVRPPTVPEGAARLRLSVTAAHDEEDIDRLVEVMGRGLRAC